MQARNFIKKIIYECNICKRHEGKSYTYPEIPPLPRQRVMYDFVFSYIAIDYAGPVYVKNVYGNDENMYKAWIVIITCANSRA